MDFDSMVEVLQDFGRDLVNEGYEETLPLCGEALRNNFVEIFASQTSSDGEAWREHSEYTTALHGPHPLLILSGDLYEQLTSDALLGERRVTAETNLEYADWNNKGIPSQNLPKREFMYLTEETMDACVDHVGDHVFEIMPGEPV